MFSYVLNGSEVERLDRCPFKYLDSQAVEILNFVNMCSGEMGGSYLPSQLVEETEFFFNVNNVIANEKGYLQKCQQEKSNGKQKS